MVAPDPVSTGAAGNDVENDQPKTFRQKTWQFFEDPSSSKPATYLALSILLLILFSCTTFILESVPSVERDGKALWFPMEAVCIALFTVEFIIRLACCPKIMPFVKNFLNWIDLISIIPFYVELLLSALNTSTEVGFTRIFRVVRLVRVFRVFKLSRYSSRMQVVGQALYQSKEVLVMLCFVLLIIMIVFSSLIYYVERGEWVAERRTWIRSDGTPSPFMSIPDCFYWTIVTVTTVGYGDMVPITTWGRIIAVVCMLSGILMIALPISIIGVNFTTLWEEKGLNKSVVPHEDVLENETRPGMIGASFKSFAELMEAIRINQEDIESLLRDTRKKSQEWEDLIEQNSKKCKDIKKLTSVLREVLAEAGPEVKELVSSKIEEIREQFCNDNDADPLTNVAKSKWRNLSLARLVLAAQGPGQGS